MASGDGPSPCQWERGALSGGVPCRPPLLLTPNYAGVPACAACWDELALSHSFIHSFTRDDEHKTRHRGGQTDSQRGMHISRILFSSKGSSRASFLYTVALHPLVASPRPAVRTLHTLNLSLTSSPSQPSKSAATGASNLHTQQAISQSLHHICCPSSPIPLYGW